MKRYLSKLFRKSSLSVEKLSPLNSPLHSEVDFLTIFQKNDDFVLTEINNFKLAYFNSLIDQKKLETVVFPALTKNQVPIQAEIINRLNESEHKLLVGQCLIRDNESGFDYLLDIKKVISRAINPPETEATIIGPQLGFNENIDENINLVRNFLQTSSLVVQEFFVGKVAKKKIYLLFIQKIANEEHVSEITKRLNQVDLNFLIDSHYLEQVLTDQPYSIFPQMLQTERVDRVCANLLDGKIALLVDGSPFACTLPHVFIENLQSPEDYYLGWISGSFLRILRYISVITSISLTALYVAIMTFHYLIIPPDLVILIAKSRAQVPFSPLVEALLMELSVELLREAGSRLPTRIGQTVGIVGGIVIGQAAVLAGLTSNILIIIVSFTMLSTLVIPSYGLSNSLRVIRFPLLILSGFMGGLGLVFGLMILMIYMSRIESFGIPYFSPFMPIRVKDLKDSIIRLPIQVLQGKPSSSE